MTIIEIIAKLWVGTALLLFTAAVLMPDPPHMKIFKSLQSPFIYWTGTLMTWTTTAFADIAFIYWVS